MILLHLNKVETSKTTKPSTTGSRVHATHYCLLSLLPPHTVPASRRRSSSGRCIAAHLQPVHKAMGDKEFATGTDSSCGWSSAKECRSQVRAQSLVLFLLSPFSWAVFAKRLLQRFHLLTKNLNKLQSSSKSSYSPSLTLLKPSVQ